MLVPTKNPKNLFLKVVFESNFNILLSHIYSDQYVFGAHLFLQVIGNKKALRNLISFLAYGEVELQVCGLLVSHINKKMRVQAVKRIACKI